jgi:hypothetical protein
MFLGDREHKRGMCNDDARNKQCVERRVEVQHYLNAQSNEYTHLFTSEILGGESLVDLNEVHVLHGESRNLERLVDSWHRSVAHDCWVNTDGTVGDNACKRGKFVLLDSFLARKNESAGAVTDTRSVTSRHKPL